MAMQVPTNVDPEQIKSVCIYSFLIKKDFIKFI